MRVLATWHFEGYLASMRLNFRSRYVPIGE